MKDISASGAARNTINSFRHDLIIREFIDQMAFIMGQGVETHGEDNWKQGFDNQGRDIWNHIYEHERRYRDGDRSEPHLAKMAIGLMFQDYFDRKDNDDGYATPTQDSGGPEGTGQEAGYTIEDIVEGFEQLGVDATFLIQETEEKKCCGKC